MRNQGIKIKSKLKSHAINRDNYVRSLIEASLDPLVTISAEGKITDVNEASIKVTGIPREKLIGTDFSNYFTDPQKAQEGYLLVFKKGFVADYPLTIKHENGKLTDVLYNASVYKDDKGNVLGVFAAARDVTTQKWAIELKNVNKELVFQNEEKEKRAAELFIANKELAVQNKLKEKRAKELIIANKELACQNELKEKRAAELVIAKERAEESDRLKSAFLANMSHEIRTPMNGILGFASLLKEADLTGEEQTEYINIIDKSGIRMLNIINDIVDISKIESGQMEVLMKESDINEQIDFIYTFFKPEIKRKNILFSCKKALPSNKAIVISDREKIYAILTNLVKNAIKFTNEGSIEIGYTIVKREQNQFLQFFVKDTGIGIPKNRQKAIFERFIQADIADNMARQGAGLGLSISKAYIEMLGGTIRVESKEANVSSGMAGGSIFYFTLPYKTQLNNTNGMAAVVSDVVEKGQINKLKILIVEDDETSDLLISTMIKKISHEVLHAKNGLEAIEMCRNYPNLDLILMDIKMPGMNGYEATRQIRQFNKEVVIIAQSAFGLSGDKKKAIDAGCNNYISKPILKDKLLALIKKHFIKEAELISLNGYDSSTISD